jgi:hypothetical protein
LCIFDMASVMMEHTNEDPLDLIGQYLRERWKGVEPVLFGSQLRQEVFKRYLYDGVYQLESLLGGEAH